MISELPVYISVIFLLTAALSVYLLYNAAGNKWKVLLVMIAWAAAQSLAACSGFYTDTGRMPPRFLLMILPPLIMITVIFCTARGKRLVDGMDLRRLTLLHTVRVPVEMVLFLLYIFGLIPRIMTVEGRNFDVLAGLSAPFAFYFFFSAGQRVIRKAPLILWNVICLVLLLNIVVHGILSAPVPFQQFGFEQPNTALLYFPFVLLPSCIVPIVLFSHIVSLRQLLKKGHRSKV